MRTRIVLIFLILIFDQSSKAVFGGQFNSGISFSLLQISPFALGVAQCVLLLLVAHIMHHHVSAGLILGGGISNLIDRIMLGGVRDWITLPAFGIQNNLADWAIVFGLICFAIVQYRDDSTSTSHHF